MNLIMTEFTKSKKFNSMLERIKNKKEKSPILISGLTDVSEMSFVAGINEYSKRPIMLITYNEVQAQKLLKDLKYFTENGILFPKKEVVVYDYIAESKEIPYERINVLNQIYDNKNIIVITTIEAIRQKMIPKDVLYKNVLDFKVGQRCNLEDIKQKLIDLGYERFDLLDAKGEFSVRGDIIDISVDETKGVRIELWGDEIDSIRHFNIISQRSTDAIDKVKIYPAHEYILEQKKDKVVASIKANVEDLYDGKLLENIRKDEEEISNGNYINKIDRYFDSFYEEQETIIDYLSDKYLIFLDDYSKIKSRIKGLSLDEENTIKALIEKGRIVPDSIKNTSDIEEVESNIAKVQTVYLEKFDYIGISNIEKYDLRYRELNYFKSGIELFVNDIKNFQKDKKKVFVLVDIKEKVPKIEKLLDDNGILHRFDEKLNKNIINDNSDIVTISVGSLSNGFESYDLNQVLIVADDLVEADRRIRKRRNKLFNEAEKVVYADLKQGDYVVHRDHGIGIYLGVNTITADGTTKDYIKLKYRGDDVLYIPTSSLDLVRKYIGGGEESLQLNKLGSKDWKNATAKVKNNLRAVAKELISLYARREKSKGFAFSKDTEWQKQFEGSFPYVETDDQLRCIEEVKADMEKDKPMDRLLCGDVGYGKTEVAIRAAFKAVMDGKQVAYLVPTTVLASQQYETFRERMEEFPINVELLNRFRKPKDQTRIIKDLKLGKVDIVVGTHKLLGKNVEFKDLGLLIIDEEHRFGVKAKEKIKEYKANVDVLTMTATPIPRTLHMSVVGVRDMSLIYEPPQNRKPVQTYVLEYDVEVVKEAITKELERNGQVFYLYNRVDNIEEKADFISRLVPEARVSFAHGRMTGTEMEDIMKDFVDGKTNVLVCTTILESGIDIPNANTIIVENADRMGLAQLYQIRGRVGRSSRQGYAYITYKRDKMLSEGADKRLKAMKEFTEFGSGFKIAMRDLEIRGAGSLVGEIQHGHLEEVGYDTYCRLLDEVIREEKGEKIKEEINVQIDLNVNCYIPDTYIEDSKQKIEVYQDIALCKTEEDIENVVDELIDRFGNMPEEIENLLEISRIKQKAKEKRVIKIKSNRMGIYFTFEDGADIDIDNLMKKYKNNIIISKNLKSTIILKTTSSDEKEILKEVKDFLK